MVWKHLDYFIMHNYLNAKFLILVFLAVNLYL